MLRARWAAWSLPVLVSLPLAAQGGADLDVLARIRDEANARSQIMRSVHFFSDVYGPRLTGSPSLKAAGEWAIAAMQAWGLTNAQLEPWNFGRDGWVNERFSAHIVSPVKDSLVGEVLAWTPGTNGTVTAQAFLLRLPERPTPEQLTTYLSSVRDQVRGRIVLVDPIITPPVDMNPPQKREDDAEMRRRFGDVKEAVERPRNRRDQSTDPPPPLSNAQINRRIDEFLVGNGARVRVDDARLPHGLVTAFNNPTYDVGDRRAERHPAERRLRPHRAVARGRHAR